MPDCYKKGESPPFCLLGSYFTAKPHTQVCDGSGEDPTCSDTVTLMELSVSDHLHYMGMPISGMC